MADLIFADSHNMVAYLEKLEDNADFVEIVDFLNASPIRYALTTIVITESSVMRDLHFNDEDEPIPIVASSSQPKKTKKHRKTKRKATEISQSSGPTTLVVDETVYEERGDSVERAATTATSLDTEFERLSKQSNKPPLSRVNTLRSGEDSMKLQELMDLRTKLSDKVLDLENVKNAQALEIQKLKKRVKKLEKKSLGDPKDASKQERNKIDQDEGISWFQEDSKTQGRYGNDIRVNTASTSITTASINITTAKPVTTASALITTAGVSVSTVEPSTPPTITTTTVIEDEDITIAQTLMKMRSEKSKEKSKEKRVSRETATRLARGVIMKEASETATRPTVPP
ncbi:hypothetical protein Tco_1344945 [Tanacetum coccineum]